MNPFLKVIAHVCQASEAREDADDFLVAFYHNRATATECNLALSLALTAIRKAIALLREQETRLMEASQSITERKVA